MGAPSLQPADRRAFFSYFNGARAAFVISTNFASVDSKKTLYGTTLSGRRHAQPFSSAQSARRSGQQLHAIEAG